MENYEQYKQYYKNHILTLPGEKRTEKLLYYVFKAEPNITLKEFFDLEDRLIEDDDIEFDVSNSVAN